MDARDWISGTRGNCESCFWEKRSVQTSRVRVGCISYSRKILEEVQWH
jgi:hypothetical protein